MVVELDEAITEAIKHRPQRAYVTLPMDTFEKVIALDPVDILTHANQIYSKELPENVTILEEGASEDNVD